MPNAQFNQPIPQGYAQVVVIPNLFLSDVPVDLPVSDLEGAPSKEEFEKWVLSTFGVRSSVLETVLTNPDLDEYGDPVPETGGRPDTFVVLHQDDYAKYTIMKITLMASPIRMRWVEDVFSTMNNSSHLYPNRCKEYRLHTDW